MNPTWQAPSPETSDANLIQLVEAAADTLDELRQTIEAAAVRELLRRYLNRAQG